jgi:hypothetical protein
MTNHLARFSRPLIILLLLLLAVAIGLMVPSISTAQKAGAPCEGEGNTDACVDVRIYPEDLVADFYVDDQLVAQGVNPARIPVTPSTSVRVEVRNARDGSEDFGDVYVYSQPSTFVWVPAGQVYRYTLYPAKVFTKGYLEFTCDIRSAKEGERVACRPFIDGHSQKEIAPGEKFTYKLETGSHAVRVETTGKQAQLWSPAANEHTVNIWGGGTAYLRSRFDKNGLLTITLNQEGVTGDLYVDGERVAKNKPTAQVWVEPYTTVKVEGKAFNDPAAQGNYTWRDASANAYLAPGQERTTTLQLQKQVTAQGAAQTTTTQTSQAPASSVAVPSVAAGSASRGGFELGGQVRGSQFYGYMRQAGMSWVKFQVRGVNNVGGIQSAVDEGHRNGFKVLVSVLGDHDINFEAWTNYLGKAAAVGPDAIEIWNEPNFSREWPAEHMGGGNYVNMMLAPAYNSIKAANPNVMVISGAPTPTGAFSGCSYQPWLDMTGCDDNVWISQVASAGGARYMDCVGVHYNAGATSPSAYSGHPAGSHYSWYFGSMVSTYKRIGRPLCFTEFGYAVGPGLPDTFAWANDNTVEEQAAWLAEAARLASGRGVRLMIVWNVGGFGGGGGDPQGAYGIVRGGGCPACETLGRAMGVQ